MNGQRLDTETINHIKNSVDIVDIISSYIPLTSRGRNLFGVCPFHDDTNPSMSVSREKQIFTCFSCGATGTVFKFLQDYENISFIEAVKMCADKAGISINIKSSNTKTKDNELYNMYDIAATLYQNNLNTDAGLEAKKYLYDRKLDDKIIKKFKLGLSLNDNKLEKLLNKYDNSLKDRSGLFNKSNFKYYDTFSDRIIFPIEDLNGNIVAFSGRIYKEYKDEKPSKYKNSKETEIFKKGNILYNYRNAKEDARKQNKIIIMEGFLDLFRAYQIGVKNVVISMGTAVTKEQALLLKKMAKDVILCFDGDQAGAHATYSCANELIKLGITPKVVRLPDNLDPDEFILKNGGEEFKRILDNPINIMKFKLEYLKNNKNLDNSTDMSEYVNDILKELDKINDDILREITINKISKQTGLDTDLLKSKLSNKKEEVKKEIVIPKTPKKTNMYVKAEQYLLYYMLNNAEVIKLYQKHIGYMPTDKYRALAFEIYYFYKTNKYINVSDLMISLNDDNEKLNTINEINLLNLNDNYTTEQILDYIKTIKNYNIKVESKRLRELMKLEIDPLKKAEYAQKILEIQKNNEEVDKYDE